MITLLLGLLCILLFGAFGPGDLTPLFFIVLALILAAAATSAIWGVGIHDELKREGEA